MTTTTALPTGTWQLNTSATTVTVEAKKLGFFVIPATIAVTSGSIEIDAEHQVVNVNIVADAASYKSKNSKRNEHMLGHDLLDAENHPETTFQTDAVTPSADGYRADGTVVVKGRTSPVELAVTDIEFSDTAGSFTATATIDRKVIGIDSAPTFIIGRELQLTVSARATKTG